MPIHEAAINVTPSGYMGSKDAAAYCGLAPRTMAQMRSEGRGPRFAKMGRIKYHQSDLDEWLASFSKAQSSAEARQNQRGK